MRLRTRVAILSLAALAAAAFAAHGQPRIQPGGGGGTPQPESGGLLTRVKAEQTMELMGQAGYKEVKTGEWGNKVTYASGKVGEIPVYANHNDCNEQGCRLVTFFVDFGKQETIDLEYLNAWHRDWRFVKLYRDDDGRLLFMWDVPLYTGVAPTYLRVAATQFAQLLEKLLQYKPEKK